MLFQFDSDELVGEVKDFNENLALGMQNLLDTDAAYEGVTPYDVVFQQDQLRLLRYRSDDVVARHSTPLLIVYALVNRPYMTDLQANRSMVRRLLEQGQDVYLIDWGYPLATDCCLSLGDYIHAYMATCVQAVCADYGVDKLNILGICQGGALSLCYSALYPDTVHKLITMVTPVDFKTADNMLSHWVQNVDVDLLVDTLGNVPGELLNGVFLSLKPYHLLGQKYLSLVDLMKDPQAVKHFMRMEQWIADSPDQAGEAFRQFMQDFYQQNKLIKGEVVIDSDRVDLKQLTMPILNVYATQDHLVPPSASTALADYVGTDDYTELAFEGGHIGIYVSAKAQKTVPAAIATWLSER